MACRGYLFTYFGLKFSPDLTRPSAEVVIFGLSGGVASSVLIILVILPCITAIGCCVYHRRKGLGCCGGGCCSEDSNIV